MPKSFEWSAKFELGNSVIDGQHKMLINMVNELFNGPDLDRSRQLVLKLFKYTREHFKDEESHMQESDYPKLESHRNLHDDLITHLTELTRNGFHQRHEIMDLCILLNSWIVEHITIHDKAYADYHKTSQVKAS
ncbi:hypothetical protein BVX99_00125 [bacterium F16]|nr:hypothetical protein BVX99_00125 [bacterium F16]